MDKITGVLTPNKTPKTYISLFPDTVIARQQSVLHLHWWADDPDGMVVGYFYTWDNINWQFTTKNDLEIVFPIAGTDTIYNFKVSAVDNNNNGNYDAVVSRQLDGKTVNLGGEPFTDSTELGSKHAGYKNGKWDDGEPFIDLGDIDPNPVFIKLPISNTAPELKYLKDPKGTSFIELPESTYTVATVSWAASDLDGDNSIKSIMVALNDISDTTHWVELPGTTRYMTIVAKPPFTSDSTSCSIYVGFNLVLHNQKLPGLKLNAQNTLYVVAKDIANAKSKQLTFPSTPNKWYVRKPSGNLLIIDDCSVINDKSGIVYKNILEDSLGIAASKYDVWDIKRGATANSLGLLVPKYINPMVTETMKLFKAVFWYSDNNPSLTVARQTIKTYASEQGGGKILLSMVFSQDLDSNTISEILPLDVLKTSKVLDYSPVSFAVPVRPLAQAVGYPILSTEDEDCPFSYIRGYFPSGISSDALYNIEVPGEPIATIGLRSTDSRIVFMGFPLSYLNGPPGNLKAFFSKVLFQEFGVQK